MVTPTRQLHLGGAEFEHERFVGDAHSYLKEFRLDHRIAVWTFEIDDVVLEKSIVMPHNQNTVCVQYRLLRGERLDLQVRPFVAFRRHDATPESTPGHDFIVEVQRGHHEIRHANSPLVLRVALRPGPTRFMTDERDEHQFVYRVERDRGDPAFDSAFSPGYFAAEVAADRPVVFVASTHTCGIAWSSTRRKCSTPSAAGSAACSRSRPTWKATHSRSSWRWPRTSSSSCPAAGSKRT